MPKSYGTFGLHIKNTTVYLRQVMWQSQDSVGKSPVEKPSLLLDWGLLWASC